MYVQLNSKATAVLENDSSLSGSSPGTSDSLSPQSSSSLSGTSLQLSSGASQQSLGSLSGISGGMSDVQLNILTFAHFHIALKFVMKKVMMCMKTLTTSNGLNYT